jgi:Mrr restriction endonuclease-like protein
LQSRLQGARIMDEYQLTVDGEVFEALQARAIPFLDTPNSVLRRILELDPTENDTESVVTTSELARSRRPAGSRRRSAAKSAKGKRFRAPKGALLPEHEYEEPILKTLVELGGRAPTRELLEALEPKMKPFLQPLDLDLLDGSSLVRWKSRTQFVRLKLVQRGDMVKGSPRGVWEISEQGRQRLDGDPS